MLRWLPLLLAISLAASGWAAKKKKKSDDDTGMLPVISEDKKKKKKSDEAMTQTLPPPKEAPSAVAAEAGRFPRNATRFAAEETLHQKAVIGPKAERVRIAGVRQKPPRITLEARDIVSYYGFAPLSAAGARGFIVF